MSCFEGLELHIREKLLNDRRSFVSDIAVCQEIPKSEAGKESYKYSMTNSLFVPRIIIVGPFHTTSPGS
jgi:hypothetical protein